MIDADYVDTLAADCCLIELGAFQSDEIYYNAVISHGTDASSPFAIHPPLRVRHG